MVRTQRELTPARIRNLSIMSIPFLYSWKMAVTNMLRRECLTILNPYYCVIVLDSIFDYSPRLVNGVLR